MRSPKSSSNVHTKVRGQHACDSGMEHKLSGLKTSIFTHCDILMIQEEVTVISFMMSLHHGLITHSYHHSIFLLRYLSDLTPLSWTGEHWSSGESGVPREREKIKIPVGEPRAGRGAASIREAEEAGKGRGEEKRKQRGRRRE